MLGYRIIDQIIKSDDPKLPELLSGVYGTKQRPTCLCRDSGVEMYVAKIAGKFVIKRMPDTGGDHAPTCDSYEPPAELSGLGHVMGSAIQVSPEDGLTALKLDFSLTKGASRSAPIPSGVETSSVKADGNKLTLTGLLHCLWEDAGMNRWSPAMTGKRSWYVVRKYVKNAAEDKTTKGSSLADVLYMPESFSTDKKDEITQRRLAEMMKIAPVQKGTRRLMLVIGEIKEIAQSRYGHKIILKHLPDCHFMMADDLHKRLLKRFDVELGMWDALDDTHLMMIGTFNVGTNGIATLEEIALMSVTENWIPFENTFDKMLIDAMTRKERRFMKGLRYNLPSTRPLACLVASDTQPNPTAMYIRHPGASEEYIQSMTTLMDESKLTHWIWRAGESEMPPLPASN